MAYEITMKIADDNYSQEFEYELIRVIERRFKELGMLQTHFARKLWGEGGERKWRFVQLLLPENEELRTSRARHLSSVDLVGIAQVLEVEPSHLLWEVEQSLKNKGAGLPPKKEPKLDEICRKMGLEPHELAVLAKALKGD